MARLEPLPTYKGALDLTIYVEKIVGNFSRYHKYTTREWKLSDWVRCERA